MLDFRSSSFQWRSCKTFSNTISNQQLASQLQTPKCEIFYVSKCYCHSGAALSSPPFRRPSLRRTSQNLGISIGCIKSSCLSLNISRKNYVKWPIGGLDWFFEAIRLRKLFVLEAAVSSASRKKHSLQGILIARNNPDYAVIVSAQFEDNNVVDIHLIQWSMVEIIKLSLCSILKLLRGINILGHKHILLCEFRSRFATLFLWKIRNRYQGH